VNINSCKHTFLFCIVRVLQSERTKHRQFQVIISLDMRDTGMKTK